MLIRRFAWPLLAATFAALAVTSLAGAGHGPSDAVNAVHLGQINSTTVQTAVQSSSAAGGAGLEGSAPFTGLSGVALSTTLPDTSGVRGTTSSTGVSSSGVYGTLIQLAPSVTSAGVRGDSFSIGANGAGVFGRHNASSGTAPGVLGRTDSSSDFAAGVQGTVTASTGTLIGAAGTATASPNGIGVYGAGGGIGVLGSGPLAGLFLGNVYVGGTFSKAAGGFKIDHPLAPARRYLQHSFVESPDMKNVYDGVVRTNEKGFATVRLPRYFQALNRSFRYQLTLLGRNGWGAQAVVWEKIKGNRFVVRSKPRVEVSWQVTGIRKDPYATAHRIQPELTKDFADQGRYLQPQLYGQPHALAVHSQSAVAGG